MELSSQSLQAVVDELAPPPSPDVVAARLDALRHLEALVAGWVAKTLIPKLPGFGVDNLFTLRVSGSQRFDVYDAASDIDVLLVASSFIEQRLFFESLSPALKADPRVTNLQNIAFTRVPIIALDVGGVPVDLLWAGLSIPRLPTPFDVMDSAPLAHLDLKTLQSLNASRATEYMLKYTTNCPHFTTLLKTVRLWAKASGVYGAKYGYLGGVQCCLLALAVVQPLLDDFKRLHDGGPEALVRAFFRTYTDWDWQRRVVQFAPLPGDLTRVKNYFSQRRLRDEAAVVLLPTQPVSNATFNVNRVTLVALERALKRGDALARAGRWRALLTPWSLTSLRRQVVKGKRGPYIVTTLAKAQPDFEFWRGKVDSKIRMLAKDLTGSSRAVAEVYTFPKCWDCPDKAAWVLLVKFCDVDGPRPSRALNVTAVVASFYKAFGLTGLADASTLQTKVLLRRADLDSVLASDGH